MAETTDLEASARATTRARGLEAIGFALLAALPVLPHLAHVLEAGVPRFGLFGDFALLEQATRHVWSGDTLLGPYSRFQWNHPGPLFFYVAAPFQAAFGTASTGLYVATCVVNAMAAGAIGACMRLWAGRAHAIGAVLVVLAWFAAFGSISANPWNPLVIVLPLTAFLVATALLARGTSAAAYPLVTFGALVSQTHIAAVSTVGAAGLAGLTSFLVSTRRHGAATKRSQRFPRTDERRLIGAAVLGVALFLPPIVEQATAPVGNLRKVVNFFAARSAPLEPLPLAIDRWMTATSWMPERLLSGALRDEGAIPLVMHWDPIPDHVSTTALSILGLKIAAIAACALIAARRHDGASLSLLGFGVLGAIIAIGALQAIVGPSYHYLVFWTTAADTVAWMGVLSTVASATGAALGRWPRIGRSAAAFALVLALAAAWATTALQRDWLAKCPWPPASRPFESDALRAVYDVLRERVAAARATAVIHPEGAWDMAHAIVLELEKDGFDVRVEVRDRWNYVGVRSSEGLSRPMHFWFSTTPLPLACADALEFVTKKDDISMYTAHEPSRCAPR